MPAVPAQFDPFEAAPATDRSGPPASDVRELAARGATAHAALEAIIGELDASGDRRASAEARTILARALLEGASADARARTLLEDAAMLHEELGDHEAAAEVLDLLREAEEGIEASPASFSAIYLPRPPSGR